MEHFYYEVPSLERKEDALEFIKEFINHHSEIHGCGFLQDYIDHYEEWLERLKKDREEYNKNFFVPTETYFMVRESDHRIVGMINIRLHLSDTLNVSAGNIGYGIRPSERGKGYGKINLYMGLKKCFELGMKEVLLFCETRNDYSRKTILALGGVFQRKYYWNENWIDEKYIIPVLESLEQNKDLYEKYMCTLKR